MPMQSSQDGGRAAAIWQDLQWDVEVPYHEIVLRWLGRFIDVATILGSLLTTILRSLLVAITWCRRKVRTMRPWLQPRRSGRARQPIATGI
jgi:hypothetical protein